MSFFSWSSNASYQPPPPARYVDYRTEFDGRLADLKLSLGEQVIDLLEQVEDTKGNNGEAGTLTITNLRLIWRSLNKPQANLAIGLNCIQSVLIREANSKLRGKSRSLFVQVRMEKTRFEFIFTSLAENSHQLFANVRTVVRAYQSTRLYRDLALRGYFFKDKQLELLPRERLACDVITGVWNLSGDQGHLGAMHVTNIRIVWQSMVNEGFNMSLPYLQIVDVDFTESKYGRALVVETSELSGPYTLGFRVDPVSRLDDFVARLRTLWLEYHRMPDYGVEVLVESQEVSPVSPTSPSPSTAQPPTTQQEEVQILDEQERYFQPSVQEEDLARVAQAYAVPIGQSSSGAGDPFVYDPYLGLAVERPAATQGASINMHQLWTLS